MQLLTMLFLLLCWNYLPNVAGFLLEPAHTTNYSNNRNCLTFDTFVQEKTELQQDIQNVQHQTDQMLQVLTSQLQQKLSFLELEISEKKNESEILQILNKYGKEYRELAKNHTILVKKYDDLQLEYNSLQSELMFLQNKTTELSKELSDIKSAISVNQALNLQDLQNQLQLMQKKTDLLTNNQNARNEDFLALYNKTVNTDMTIKNLNNKVTTEVINVRNEITNQLDVYTQHQNQSLSDISSQINTVSNHLAKNLSSQIQSQNQTFLDLYNKVKSIQNNIIDGNRKVVVTACVNGDHTYSYTAVKFWDVKTHVGISNSSLTSLKTTGKFICEKSGLYYISVNIRSRTNSQVYRILRNNYIFLTGATTTWPSSEGWSTSTTTGITEAQENDTLSVYVPTTTTLYVQTPYSCLTIIKIQ